MTSEKRETGTELGSVRFVFFFFLLKEEAVTT